MHVYNTFQTESRRIELQHEAFIEFVIKSIPVVQSCAVLSKKHDVEGEGLIAFIVTSAPISDEQLRSQVKTRLPAHLLPKVFVPLTALPLTSEGLVDRQALDRIEVIDNSLVQEWEKQIHALDGIERAIVLETEHYEKQLPLHLADVILGWDSRSQHKDVSLESSSSSQPNLESSNTDVLSICLGLPLQIPAAFPKTITDFLRRSATEHSQHGTVYVREDGTSICQSYDQLKQEAERILAGLRQLGLQPQDKVLFQLGKGEDFLPAFWGCILGGFIPVPLSGAASNQDKNSAARKLEQAWNQLNYPIVLTSEDRSEDICGEGQHFGQDNFRAVFIEQLRLQEPDSNWYNSQPEDIAFLLLTSGSTGVPKAVKQSHQSIIALISGFAAMHDYSIQDISVNWMPLDHVGGIVMCHLRDICLGCLQIQVSIDYILQKPLRWLDLIDEYKATFTWAPNFAYELINNLVPEVPHKHWDLSSMRFMLTGGETVSAKTSRTCLKTLAPFGLPSSAIRPAWGMSETCSGVIFSDNFNLETTQDSDRFVEVGLPMPGFAMRITEARNQIVAERTMGNLEVKGPTVTSGYYQNETVTRDSFTEDGWFKTGDLAVIKNGRLTIRGRSKDIIIINGLNFHSYEIEEIVQENQLIESSFTVACSVCLPGESSEKLAIFFHPKKEVLGDLSLLIDEIRQNISSKTGINPHFLLPVEKEDIPKTSIGKIQRSQLKQKFESGEFDRILKKIDILEGNSNTIPPWFFKKSWQRKEIIHVMPSIKKSHALIFVDELGLGRAISQELSNDGREFIIVEVGEEFKKISNSHYSINPVKSEQYIELIQDLKNEGISISKIFHLWTYGDLIEHHHYDIQKINLDLDLGIYSLLFLIQSLEKAAIEGELDLFVISSHSQVVFDNEPLMPAKASMLGLIKSVSKEIRGLNCSHIDIPSHFGRETAENILRESFTKLCDQEICYRNKQRFTPYLQKIDFTQELRDGVPLERDGLYIISGGLGGIGIELARYLLEQYRAKVLLLGRTPLPELEDLHSSPQFKSDSEKIQQYLELKKLPGEIKYQSLDICDVSHLREAVEQVEQLWQVPLSGMIHLAGMYEENPLIEETQESLASVLQPKVFGTFSLYQILKDRPNCLFLQFSSVTGFFGGSTIGAYTAANCFQNSFSNFLKRIHPGKTYCFNWSTWQGTGMSQNSLAGEALTARGYQQLSVKQGINAFLVGLGLDLSALYIGLDSNNLSIRQSMQAPPYRLKILTAFVKIKNNVQPDIRSIAGVKDRYQTVSICNIRVLKEIPIIETGEIDLLALRSFRSKNKNIKKKPRSDIELKLAKIWKKLLCVDFVGVDDNFFALGGSSLLGIQLISQLEEQFSLKLSPSALFEAPTIAKQVQLFQENARLQQTIILEGDNPESSVILLKLGTTDTPLFFAPGGGAVDVDFLMYAPLFQSLDAEQSVYVLEARSFDREGNRYTRVEDMAKDYAEQIQCIQPKGPYILGGECIGGVLALEIARQLQARGESIALIAMLDSGLPLLDTYLRHLIRSQYKTLKEKLAYYLRRLKKIRFVSHPEVSSEKSTNRPTVDSDLESIQQSVLQGRKGYNLKEKNFRSFLIFCHRPQNYEGRIALLLNEARYHERYTEKAGPDWTNYRYKNDPSLGWNRVVKNGVETRPVPGNHNTYIREFAHDTARVLQDCIDQSKKMLLDLSNYK
jgi:acyl-CoA synthetase (AMP-forming)/AMP-acid ligase II/thioesterase domain-containing protein/NADP-dependent 3-hydroxy acid dehydrogenase YdfG/acyl carrier protein